MAVAQRPSFSMQSVAPPSFSRNKSITPKYPVHHAFGRGIGVVSDPWTQPDTVLANPAPLSTDFEPPNVVALDHLTFALRSATAPLVKHASVGGNTTLYGPNGSGKTLATRRLVRALAEHSATNVPTLGSFYLNAQRASAEDVLLDWLGQLMDEAPRSGVGIATIKSLINRALRVRGIDVAFLALDEVDKCDDLGDLLPVLLRPEIGLQVRIQVLMVSNHLEFKEELPSHVRRSLKESGEIVARGYQSDEIIAILKQRAELGLRPGTWDEAVLAYVAAQVQRGERPGDARRAVEILRAAAMAANEASAPRIDVAHIEQAIGRLERDRYAEAVRGSDLHHKAALATLIVLSSSGIARPTTRTVHEAMVEVRRRASLDPIRTKDRTRQIMASLASYGLVDVRTGKVASGRGRTNWWTLKDPQAVRTALGDDPDLRSLVERTSDIPISARWRDGPSLAE